MALRLPRPQTAIKHITGRRSLTAIIRGFKTHVVQRQAKAPGSISERYIEARERAAQLEGQWVKHCETSIKSLLDRTASLKKRDTASKSSQVRPTTSFRPFAWPGSDEPVDLRVRKKAQQEAESHSKYAWTVCNDGSKLRLQAGGRYFSLDETKPGSGIYFVSIARQMSGEALKKAIASSKGGKNKTQRIIFPYKPREVFSVVKGLEEAIRLADALVEKEIEHPKLRAALETKAGWRDESSTIRQFYFLQFLGASDEVLNKAADLSKGEVFALITEAIMKSEPAIGSPVLSEAEDNGDRKQSAGWSDMFPFEELDFALQELL